MIIYLYKCVSNEILQISLGFVYFIAFFAVMIYKYAENRADGLEWRAIIGVGVL